MADRHTMTVQSWLSMRAPHARRFNGIGVTACSSGLAAPLRNVALGCNYPPGTSDKVIDREIATVRAFFAQRAAPWLWWVGPQPHPRNMSKRLERCGIVHHAPLPVMVAPLPVELPPIHSGIQVWPATNRGDLEAASAIQQIAFEFPAGVGLNYFEAMAEDWLARNPARLYLARRDDGPTAAIGALIVGADAPGVYIMATLPEWRRCGLGRAVLGRILLDALAEGYQLITLTASPFGYPLYRQFGFEHVFNYTIYYSGN